MGALIVA
jgi:hypothetical protein